MSNDEDLSAQVLQFIGMCIPTVPHLEALLLIWETRPKPWSTAELAARLYVAHDVASQLLRDLERCDVIEKDDAHSMSFKYNPQGQWDGALPQVSHTYRHQLGRVARYIHSQGSTSVRAFSRAFRLRRQQ